MTPSCWRTAFTPRSVSPSHCARPHSSERFVEKCELFVRADGDADRFRRAEACEGPHDHSFAQQRVEKDLSVFAGFGVDEVGDGGPHRREAVTLQDRSELLAALPIRRTPPRELAWSVETCERRHLRLRVQIERATHFPDRRHHVRRPDGVADAETREPVDLRERASDEDATSGLEML